MIEIEKSHGSFRCNQIIDSRFDGKWIELWFANGKMDPTRFDQCCKTYMISSIVHNKKINGARYDFVGLWVMSRWDEPNWEIVDVASSLVTLDHSIIHGVNNQYVMGQPGAR